jgi:PAT family beta-lactamase induction signal transducer AmpG
MFLGFASGLPLALSGSTLQVWASENGVSLQTIGLFTLVGTPYAFKFLWAPLIDGVSVPLLTNWLGRRRGWLVLSQLLLMAAILALALTDPARSPLMVAFGALMVATASATQDIVIDAFRVESLAEDEQAAGMASYVAAYRVGMVVSTAGALFLVTGFEHVGFVKLVAWQASFAVMAALVRRSASSPCCLHMSRHSRASPRSPKDGAQTAQRVAEAAVGSFREFFSQRDALLVSALRDAVQVHRRLRRRDDGAVHHRCRLHAERLCDHRQGRRPRGDADRRLRRRLHRARAAARCLPVDRWNSAGCLEPHLRMARVDRTAAMGADSSR